MYVEYRSQEKRYIRSIDKAINGGYFKTEVKIYTHINLGSNIKPG